LLAWRPAAPLEDSMPFRSLFATAATAPLASSGLLRSLSLRVGSFAVAFGLFAVSATGCGGCDDAAVICDEQGLNCEICDGYGCHPADPNASSGTGGNSGTASTGTSGGCDSAQTTCPCDATTPCATGTQCLGGICIDGCDFTYECGGGNVCVNGQCAPGCDAQTPCAAGYVCTSGACIPDPTNPECSATAPCVGGESCINGLCTSTCTANADCAAGEICNSGTGACIPDPSPKASCSDTVKCIGDGQQCLADGYCHYPCTNVPQCQLHDNRFKFCEQGICKTLEEVNPECTVENPCPAGKNCISNTCS
jgi:hypothetical protein